MLMKVFNKGQIVIPAHIRKMLKIKIGDMVDVDLNLSKKRLKIKKPRILISNQLAGCFAKKAENITFPSCDEMNEALKKGLIREK